VVPGSQGAPTTLYCLSQCPTTDSLAAFPSGNSSTSPFDAQTSQQWFSAVAGNTVSYTFDAHGLEHNKSGTLTPMVLEQASQFPSGSPYSNGVMTGRLFDTSFAPASFCPWNAPSGSSCVQEPANPTTYYTWQTGTNPWSQALWLTKTSGSSVVAFDPPVNVAYTVPANTSANVPYGSWAGKSIQLQFNGFGNLQGIPGNCVNPVDNSPIDCNTPNVRYVPSFALPDGASMTLTGATSTPLLVKALDAELRLANLGSNAAQCSGLTLSTMTPPTTGVTDPSVTNGIKPTPTVNNGSTKVIDGVIQ
jgi:hypothetical protein